MNLSESDRKVLDVIKSKKEMAIWSMDLREETNLPDPVIIECLKNLQRLSLIKEVSHVRFKGRKHYIAAEFEPSEKITGCGFWFVDGRPDTKFINILKKVCVKFINDGNVLTADDVYKIIKSTELITADFTVQHIREMLRFLVLDSVIIEVTSTGLGEYHKIPVGKSFYKLPPGNVEKVIKTGAMVSNPCGVCPRIRQCTPDGVISPSTCVYYNKWLDF